MRKIRSRVAADPELTVEEPDIVDALRYTVILDDEPPGSYVIATRRLLAALEDEGHRVVRVKNYWPRGDNYSGVNTIMQAGGLEWELQFHTTDSYRIQRETRALYEELRLEATPPDRKRELFDIMTTAWDAAAVPADVLEPHNMHEEEEIRDRPRP
jgi:hypothetical protein